MFKSLFRVGLAAAGLALLGARMGGCQGAYYRALEAVGVHKRDLLVERIREGLRAGSWPPQPQRSRLTSSSFACTSGRADMASPCGEGGSPVRSRVTRRINVSLSASPFGDRPSDSNFCRT